MKRNILLLAIISIFLGLSSCEGSSGTSAKMDEPKTLEYSYVDDMNDINDVIRYSTNIVKARLVSTEDFDGTVQVYLFEVEDDFTNNTAQQIHMYDAYDSRYVVGNSYYLFLGGMDDPLYPHTIYTTVSKELIVDASSLQSKAKIANRNVQLQRDDIVAEIDNAIQKGVVGERIGPRMTASDAAGASLSNEADVIAKVRVSDELLCNKYVSAYTVEVVEMIKGPVGSVASAMPLPPGLDPSEMYFIYLKENGEGSEDYQIFSRACPIQKIAD